MIQLLIAKQFRWCLSAVLTISLTGCMDGTMVESFKSKHQGESKEETGSTPTASTSSSPPPSTGRIAPEEHREIVDRKSAMAANPNWVETQNRIDATDPVSAAGQAYFAISTRAHLLSLKQSIDLYKAENERNPTYSEFSRMLSESNVTLKGLYRWQVYAYDQDTGLLSVLEDQEMKKEIHGE